MSTQKTGGKPAFDAVLFDMDNVLIDTRQSYLQSIRWTVELYLTAGRVPLFQAAPRAQQPALLSAKDVDQFKLLGGFNDDWDCCYGILIYLLTLPVKIRTILNLKKKMNITKLAKDLKERPVGVNGIVKAFGRPPFVTIEKISHIFQEVYLGKKLIRIHENRDSTSWKKKGLIEKEKLIFRKSTLERIREMEVELGIATGRPLFEARYALEQFGISSFFAAMTTMDEIKKAERHHRKSLRKPNPYSLIETAQKIGPGKKFLYVGDLPDDVLAANRAKSEIDISSAAFPYLAKGSKETLAALKKAEPDYVLNKPSDLVSLLQRKRKD